MKKFVFSLQSLYDVTLSTEKHQKTQIKRLENLILSLVQQLDQMKEDYLDAKDECADEMKKGMSSEKLSQYNFYFESLINMMIVQKDNIIKAEHEKEKWIKARIETRRELKSLDKIRENQYALYLEELKKEQEKEIGDLVSFQVASK